MSSQYKRLKVSSRPYVPLSMPTKSPPVCFLPEDNPLAAGLSVEAQAVLRNLDEKKQFVLVQGLAGSGKSVLIAAIVRFLQAVLPELKVVVVCPTAMAAVNLHSHGVLSAGTLHSRFSLRCSPPRTDAHKPWVQDRAGETDLLILDEISMVDGEIFELVSDAFAIQDKQRNFPFGTRVRVLMVGDFLQIPPISGKFVFSTDCWPSADRLASLRLRTNYRQQEDLPFFRSLCAIRTGDYTHVNRELFAARVGLVPPDDVTRLFAFKNDVERYNAKRLDELKTEFEPGSVAKVGEFKQATRFPVSDKDIMLARAKTENATDLEKLIPVDHTLRIKVGAVVMVRKNGVVPGEVNGSTGTVVAVERTAGGTAMQFVSVQFAKGVVHRIARHIFDVPFGRTLIVEIAQFPFIVAFATSIHKAQGSTMQRAVVDPKVFGSGMLYVALSRVVSLQGLFLTSALPRTWPLHKPATLKMEEDKSVLFLCAALVEFRDQIDVRQAVKMIAEFF